MDPKPNNPVITTVCSHLPLPLILKTFLRQCPCIIPISENKFLDYIKLPEYTNSWVSHALLNQGLPVFHSFTYLESRVGVHKRDRPVVTRSVQNRFFFLSLCLSFLSKIYNAHVGVYLFLRIYAATYVLDYSAVMLKDSISGWGRGRDSFVDAAAVKKKKKKKKIPLLCMSDTPDRHMPEPKF